ncbi:MULTISPECIES: YezD family protein [Peribacillus]|uniref:Uncharacterized protein n=1 Tax=Peribacillus asahii TaxID=228899 RepID=A0A3Q9RL38_9BACI|nr:YezD family protein [Peribacillus asahii]AZV41990.1 hypothetical protein BAOM_1380 [Peribacillus asahii]USK86346.1 YezD family protein [Peribacillus asahii]
MSKLEEQQLQYILSSLQNIQYGSVVITVHNGEITQVDTTEKKRFPLLKSHTAKAK